MFIERGYERATIRLIAGRAGVDPAMVNHWFGGKEGLFVAAVLNMPLDPAVIVQHLLAGPRAEMGTRMAATFLATWDSTGGGRFAALVRSVTSHDGVARMLREFFVQTMFGKVIAQLDVDRADLRANLVATQIFGLGMVRYVVGFEPLAAMDAETLSRAVGPTLQRYLTGDIDEGGQTAAVRLVSRSRSLG